MTEKSKSKSYPSRPGPKSKHVSLELTQKFAESLLRRDEIAVLQGMSPAKFFQEQAKNSEIIEAVLKGRAKVKQELITKAFKMASQGSVEALKILLARIDVLDGHARAEVLDLAEAKQSEKDEHDTARMPPRRSKRVS